MRSHCCIYGACLFILYMLVLLTLRNCLDFGARRGSIVLEGRMYLYMTLSSKLRAREAITSRRTAGHLDMVRAAIMRHSEGSVYSP